MSSLLFAANSNEIYDIHYHKVDKTVGFIQGFPQVPLTSIVIPPGPKIAGPRRNSLTNSGMNFNSSLTSALHLSNVITNDHDDLNKEKDQYIKDLQNWKKAIYDNRTETFFVFPLPISLLANLPTYTTKTSIRHRAQKVNYTQRPPLPMTYLSLFNAFNQTSTISLFKDRNKSFKLKAYKEQTSNKNDNDDSSSDSDSDINNENQYHFVNSIEYIKDIEIPGPDYNSKFVNNKNNLEYIKVSDFCINCPKFGTKLIPREPLPDFFENYDEFKDSLKSWIAVEKVTDQECIHPSSFWITLNGRNKASTKKDKKKENDEDENDDQTDNESESEPEETRHPPKKNIFKKPERKTKAKIFSTLFNNYLKKPTFYRHIHQNDSASNNENMSDNENSSYNNDSDSILTRENDQNDNNDRIDAVVIEKNDSHFDDEQLLTLRGSLTSLLSFIKKATIKRTKPSLPNIKKAQIIINEFKAGSPHCYDFLSSIEEISNNKEIDLSNYPELGKEPFCNYSLTIQDKLKYELSTVSESPVHRYQVFRLFLNALVGLSRYTKEMLLMYIAFPQITSIVADFFCNFGDLTDFNIQKFVGFNNEMGGSFNNLCQFLFEAQMLDAIERFFKKNEKIYHKNNPNFSSSLKSMFSSLKDQRKTVLESASKTLQYKFKEIEEDINNVDDYEVYKDLYETEVNNKELSQIQKNKSDQIYIQFFNDDSKKNETIKKDSKVHSPLVFSVINLLLNYLPDELIQFFDRCNSHFLNFLLQLNYTERYYLGQICSHILCLNIQNNKLPQNVQMEFLELMNLKIDNFATRFSFPTVCHLFCQLLTLDTKTVLPADRITLLFTNTLKLTEIQYDCAITLLESLCKIFKRRLKKKDNDYMNVFDMFFDSLVIPFNVDKFKDEFLEERMLSSVYNLFPFINNEHQESTFKEVFIPKFISNDCDKANVAWKVFRRNPSNISKFSSSKALINAIINCIQESREKQVNIRRNRISTIKPNHREISTPTRPSRVNPLISPSASSSFLPSNMQAQPTHSQQIQPSPSIQLPSISPLALTSSSSHNTMPPLANTNSMISPLAFDLSSSDREERVRTELLRKKLCIVSKMHLLLFICGFSEESKKNDRSIKSMRITQTAEINALLDDVKEAIYKKIPEIYKFKNLVKSVKIAYRIGSS